MTLLNRIFRSNESLHSLVRFLAVGAVGTLLDIGLFAILNILLGVPALIANTLSYSAGIVNNYVLHRNWTYASRPQRAVHKQFVQFAVVSLSALALNNLIVFLFTPLFARFFTETGVAAILAKVMAVGIGVGWNFLINHFWTFRTKPQD